jgi:hypothetical protein
MFLRAYVLIVALYCAFSSPSAHADEFGRRKCDRVVLSFVLHIAAQPDADTAGAIAHSLLGYVSHHHARCGQRAIEETTKLLTHSDETVRFFAVNALAWIGPRARSAVPALEKARVEAYEGVCIRLRASTEPVFVMHGPWLHRTIEYALEKITRQRVEGFNEAKHCNRR